jgi:hypothetical protein
MSKQEIYLSCDVEADGPIPGVNSMLSFGCAAFTADKKMLGTFTANLETLPDAIPDPDTMAWWKTQPKAWAACRALLSNPKDAMEDFHEWIGTLPGKPVFVGYPATYDFMFVYWYLMKFVGNSPFSHSGVDIKTLAMAAMKSDYRNSSKKQMPKRWFDHSSHTHVALQDAIEQGQLFCNILQEIRTDNSSSDEDGPNPFFRNAE